MPYFRKAVNSEKLGKKVENIKSITFDFLLSWLELTSPFVGCLQTHGNPPASCSPYPLSPLPQPSPYCAFNSTS